MITFALFNANMRYYHYPILLGLFLSSCVRTEFSPNQKIDSYSPRNLNAKNLAQLASRSAGPKIRIAVSGDTQRMYKEAEDFVAYINARENDIDFVILNGDISDFGLLMEFQWMNAIYAKLKVPYIAVIGNHDLVANGNDVYSNMFGPLNFSFIYGGIKFVCHDTNSREYNFNRTVPNLAWLRSEFSPSPDFRHIVGFSHVPPNDADFDATLRKDYEAMYDESPLAIASIHSHQHSPDVVRLSKNGVPFIITNGVINRAFTLIDIENGKVDATAIKF